MMRNGVYPLQPEDLFALTFLRDAHLAPNGRSVVYTTSSTDTEERFEIWIEDLERGETRRLFYPGNARSPRWSPDGRWIAFVADNRVRVAAFPSLSVSEPLTDAHLTAHGVPTWCPDNARLAISLSASTAAPGPRRITTKHFRADGVGFLDTQAQQIYEINHLSRTVHSLTAAKGVCSQPEWSPCGRRILFFEANAGIPAITYPPRLLCIDVDDGEVVEVLGEGWYASCARWLPGGDRIAVAAARRSGVPIPTMEVWVIGRAGVTPDLRTPELIGYVGLCLHHDMPNWESTFDSTLIVADRHTVFVTVQCGGSAEIWRVALEGQIVVERVLTGARSCVLLDGNLAANVLLYAVTDLRSPPELWYSTIDTHQERRLTRLNDELLDQWPKISVQQFTVDTADGVGIDTWFLAPEGYTEPLPTILFIHGGPYLATGYAFRYDFLLLAAYGFGVLFANFRGSLGYGQSFASQITGHWGERGFPDHMGVMDAAIVRGLADAERLGVWGVSHGGFATCWIVGHTNRFKAAVAESGPTNFATFYYLTDIPDVVALELGGRPHEIPEVYRVRSAITYAHRCRTPTMLLHGEDDLRAPISEAEQFYRALQDAGCPTELFRIPACSHQGDSIGPLSARRAQNQALLSWFQRYL